MSEWASKFINAVMPDRGKVDFDQYLTEVSNDQAERMYFQKEIDIEYECRPTYEQLSIERIIDEANRNINGIKALENLINERLAGLGAFANTITKYRGFAEAFDNNDGTLKISIEPFCQYLDQEIQQSKQQIFLGDLKRSLTEMRNDASRRITEYTREIANVEQDLCNCEKKIAKLKKEQEKNNNYGDDSLTSRSGKKSSSFSSKDRESSSLTSTGSFKFTTSSHDDSFSSSSSTSSIPLKIDKELNEEIRALLKSISNRDQVLSASRKAFQKLDRECKRAIYYTLRKILDKEKDNYEMMKLHIDKLDRSLQKVNIEEDLNSFITSHKDEDGSLVLNSHALSLLSDLVPHPGINIHGFHTPQHQQHHQQPLAGATSPSSTDHQKKHHSITKTIRRSLTGGGSKDDSANKRKGGKFSSLEHGSGESSPVNNRDRNATANNNNNAFQTPTSNNNTATAALQLHAEEYTKYLTNIFYAVDEKKPGGDENNDETEEEESSETTEGRRRSISTNDDLVDRHSLDDHNKGGTAESSSLNTKRTPNNNNYKRGDETDHDPYAQKFQGNRRFSINAIEAKTLSKFEIAQVSSNLILRESVEWLCNIVRSTKGREAFISELNQFRSKKVDLQAGFNALVIVLWTALSYCQRQNDVRTAKVIMMLSQTFYRVRPGSKNALPGQDSGQLHLRTSNQSDDNVSDEEEEIARRGVAYRQYVKEKILGHPLWEDGNYWEQALWQCAIEQLQTIPYERPWYEMDRESRERAVGHVHDVVFSQVMAITHSMMELGCSQQQSREFIYRMCVVHQLSESQRQDLLAHILRQRPSER